MARSVLGRVILDRSVQGRVATLPPSYAIPGTAEATRC